MKKVKILLCLILVLGLTGCGNVAKLENGQEAVVTIKKGEDISVDDLYNEMKDKYALSVTLDMIDTQLLNKIYKTDKKANEYVDGQIKQLEYAYEQYYSSTYSSFEEMLTQAYGVNSTDEAKDLILLGYKKDLATDDYIKDNISDKEIKKYYDDEIVGDIKASHILIKANYKDDDDEDAITQAKKEAEEKAKDLIKQLDEVKNDDEKLKKLFKELAKKNSEDDGTKENGGELDWFNKGEMDSNFEEAAYKLKVGEYTSTPVESSYGYHIILKTGEKDKKDLKDVKEDIIEALVKEKKEDDSTIQNKALIALREKYGVEFEDKDLKKQYKTYKSNATTQSDK